MSSTTVAVSSPPTDHWQPLLSTVPKRDYIAIHCFLGEFDHVLKHRVSHRISCVPVHGDGPIIAVYGDWFGERSISPISPSTDSLSIIRSRTFRSETVTGTT